MSEQQPRSRWKLWTGLALVAALTIGAGIARRNMGVTPNVVRADSAPIKAGVAVNTVHPRQGAMERLTVQPGSVQSYEAVQLFAKVGGFLKRQNVDIGDYVKRGQELAVVDLPEQETLVRRNEAALKQAAARVVQTKAHETSARAEKEAADAKVIQAQANRKSAAAWVKYRSRVLQRMRELYSLKSIEEKLVDEAKEKYEASLESENAAVAAISTTQADVKAANAKIDRALADVDEALSEVDVAKAELEKSKVILSFATIVAPFDGVITHRSFFVGDFVRAANEGGVQPLLTVERTDKLRVVVQIPDRDVPYADPGDAAHVEIDALPGPPLEGRISRIAHSEDQQTRLMHVEIDLPNPTGKICQGMYGRVTIVLDKATDQLSVPSACLVGKAEDGKGSVYVIRGDHVHLLPVKLGADNGLRVAVTDGLKAEDQVVLQPGNALAEGMLVTPTLWNESQRKTTAH
jgi:RND family efflux transporter MFP subunit